MQTEFSDYTSWVLVELLENDWERIHAYRKWLFSPHANTDLGCSFWWMCFQHHDFRVLFIMTWSMAFHQSWSKIYFYVYVAYTFIYYGVKCSSEEKIKGIKWPIKLRTSLIKTVAFIFPAWFEQAISCSVLNDFLYLFALTCRRWSWKRQRMTLITSPWCDSTPGELVIQGSRGVISISKATKKVLMPEFFLFFQLESDDGLAPDKRLIRWLDLWPAEQFQYPSLHW